MPTRNNDTAWLQQLLTAWSDPKSLTTVAAPLHRTGLRALEYLCTRHHNLAPTPPTTASIVRLGRPCNLGQPLTPALVLIDLVKPGDHNIYDFAHLESAGPEATYTSISQDANELLNPDPEPWTIDRTLFGALNIEPSHDGLDLARLRPYPFHDDAFSIVSEQWFSVLTLPSAITHPHIDYFGASIYVTHICGKKLWMFWNADSYNLDVFSEYMEKPFTHDRLMQCLQRLHGLETLLTDDSPMSFIIQPGTIHACISFSVCAHSTMQVWAHFQGNNALMMMDWAARWIRVSLDGDLELASIKTQLDRLREDLEHWETICSRVPVGPPRQSMEIRLKEIYLMVIEVDVAIQLKELSKMYIEDVWGDSTD